VARITIPDGPGGDPVQVWTLRPEMGKAVGAIIDAAYNRSRLPAREREAARMRIAELNDCTICHDFRAARFQAEGATDDLYSGVSQYRDDDRYTGREKLAIEYAERFALDHRSCDDAFFGRLRARFSDDEVLDLTICLAAFLGLGRLLNVLGIEEAAGDLPPEVARLTGQVAPGD
jgi:alkylhydroperoxidase family enzyme